MRPVWLTAPGPRTLLGLRILVFLVALGPLAWLGAGDGERYDIAFVDPPFGANLWPAVLGLLPARMAADAWLYLESPADHTPLLPAEWALHRESGTREVRYALYRRVTLAQVP
jgi:16S rRNA (guanine966-N2)-methyltransferase